MSGETLQQLKHALDTDVISDREYEVLDLRLGLTPFTLSWTLQAVGDKLGVTRERVRQIQDAAMGKLRRAIKRAELDLPPVPPIKDVHKASNKPRLLDTSPYRRETVRRILSAVENGATQVQAARAGNISSATFTIWKKRYPVFAAEVRKAKRRYGFVKG